MRGFGKFLGRVILLCALLCVGLFLFGPYEEISLTPTLAESDVGADVDAYFAEVEAPFKAMTPGVEKRVVWHRAPGARTPLAIVYVHGFSATSEEIRPVPDQVAEELGANLIYTRLQGHGLDGQALAEAKVQGWTNDVAEALHVARRLADEVVIISTSTGGTMVAGLADQSDVMAQVKGMIFVSPNFGVKSPAAKLLTWPAARYWVPVVAGADRAFEPRNSGHAKYWTTAYPTVAVMQMAELVKQVFAKDFSQVTIPALFWFSDADQVVDPKRTKDLAARWAGPSEVAVQQLQYGSDPSAHVISGDIVSPGENQKSVEGFVNFIRGLQ